MKSKAECFISVDVEASGPIPAEYSLLALGACVVGRRDEGFYVELKPLNSKAVPDALKVTGLDMAELDRTGERPHEAMQRFDRAKGDRSVYSDVTHFMMAIYLKEAANAATRCASQRHGLTRAYLDLYANEPLSIVPDYVGESEAAQSRSRRKAVLQNALLEGKGNPDIVRFAEAQQDTIL